MTYRKVVVEIWLIAGVLFWLSLKVDPNRAVFVEVVVIVLFAWLLKLKSKTTRPSAFTAPKARTTKGR